MNRQVICATCEHFDLESVDPKGVAPCSAYNDTSHEPFVRWDHDPTILYGRASDMDKRVQWIEIRKREEAGNTVAA